MPFRRTLLAILVLLAPSVSAAACDRAADRFLEELLASVRAWEQINRHGNRVIDEDTDYRRYDLAKRKIYAGFHKDARDCHGVTLLANLLEQPPSPRTVGFVRALLRAGHDPNLRSRNGLTPLLTFTEHLPEFLAAGGDVDSALETLDVLLEHGADPNLVAEVPGPDGVPEPYPVTVFDGLVRVKDPRFVDRLVPHLTRDFINIALDLPVLQGPRGQAIAGKLRTQLALLKQQAKARAEAEAAAKAAAEAVQAEKEAGTEGTDGTTASDEDPFVRSNPDEDPFIRGNPAPVPAAPQPPAALPDVSAPVGPAGEDPFIRSPAPAAQP